jgi:uncharacterized protein with WD repeat
MPKSKKSLKTSKQNKAKSADAIASFEQNRCKIAQSFRVKGPIARPKPKMRRLNDNEKRVRALNKKLRDIEAIREREKAGETLDDQQLAKLDSLGHVLADLESLITG